MGHIPFPLKPEPLAELRHQAIEYREHHGGLLPETKPWHYLEKRWEINPSRFSHWHPLLGRWITEDWNLRHQIPIIPLIPHEIPDPGHCIEVPECHLKPVVTPEPSSSVLVVIGLITVVVAAHLGTRGRR